MGIFLKVKMVDTNYIKSTPGLLMILEIIGWAVAIGCGAGVLNLKEGWQAYIFSAACITLILTVILYFVIICQKLSDDRLLLGALFLCAVLMIVAVVLICVYDGKAFFNTRNVAIVAIIMTTVLIVLQILIKLGLVK